MGTSALAVGALRAAAAAGAVREAQTPAFQARLQGLSLGLGLNLCRLVPVLPLRA